MVSKLELYPHQKDALAWLKSRPKAMLIIATGLGKTIIAIKTFKPNERILIIVPNSLKLNWKIEIEKWSDFKPQVTVIKKRGETLQPGINIINYDILGKRINKKIVPSFNFKSFDRVIVDEHQMIKNSKAIRTKIAAKIIKNTPNAILLSATPMEKPIELYVPLYSLGVMKMNYHDYGMKFCDGKKLYLGGREVWDYKGKSNLDELLEIIKPQTLIMRKDILDLPPVTIKVISVDLPISKQEKSYDLEAIEKDSRAISFEGLSELIKEQALLKLPLAISHIKLRLETENKILLFCKHHEVIDILMEKLKDFSPVKLDGRDSIEKRQEAVNSFRNDNGVRIFVGQIQASGVGLTLVESNFCIFAEADWSYSSILQGLSRIDRIGQTKNVYVELLTVHKSIDEYMLRKTLEKKETIKELGL